MGGHVSETNPAQTEFTHIGPGTSTNRTAVVGPHFKFRFSDRFISERFPGQIILLQIIDTPSAYRQLLIAKRHSHQSQQFFTFLICLGRGHNTDIETLDIIDFIVVDFRENDMFLDTESVVSATVESGS